MAKKPWPAGQEVVTLLDHIKHKNHERLELAKVAIAFIDAKAFVKGRFNWGKSRKLSPVAKLWHHKDKVYDYEIILPADGWHQVLQGIQREAWIDLHLSRFRPEMIPAFIEENGKKKPVKDDFGRIEYTNEMKLDEETGSPIWLCDPLDLHVFADNAARYGVWCEDLQDFKTALKEGDKDEEVNFFQMGKLTANADVVFTPNLEPPVDEMDNAAAYAHFTKGD
jgi:hypothetical protein